MEKRQKDKALKSNRQFKGQTENETVSQILLALRVIRPSYYRLAACRYAFT